MSIRTAVAAATLIVAFPVGAHQREGVSTVDLRHYQWEHRLLLVFAPSRDEPSFRALHESLEAREPEVRDRDLVVFEVLETGPSTADGEPLDAARARLLRDRFGIPSGIVSVILVGKDGGVKLERQDRTSLDEVFVLIDSMPMRQREMRRKAP